MKIILTILIANFVLSCGPITPRHPNFSMIDDQPGESIKVKDFISITFTEKTEDGTELKGSAEYDERPLLLTRRPSHFKDDFFGMLGNLSEGDSAQFKVRIDSISQKTGRELPAGIKGKYLIYNIRVNKVIAHAGKTAREYDAAVEIYTNNAFDIEKKREPQKIRNYLLKYKLSLQQLPSGVMYKIIKPGTGRTPAIGDSVVINYSGETLSGKMFETTIASVAKNNGIYQSLGIYKPYGTRITEGKEVSVFKKTLQMFPKGAEVMLLIPSKGAYGENVYKMLQPYTPVICRLQIVDIIKSSRLL